MARFRDVITTPNAWSSHEIGAVIFDGVIDFEAAPPDPATGELKAEYQPNSSIGGPGDKLHPNRAGYLAMASAIDLEALLGEPR